MRNQLLLSIAIVFSSTTFSQSDDLNSRVKVLPITIHREEAPKEKKLTKREKELLFPSKEIQAEFKPVLQRADARLARLFPNEKFAAAAGILGVRSYFSFPFNGPRDNNDASLVLEKGNFRTMIGYGDIGMIIRLGDVALEDVKLDRPELKYLLEYVRPEKKSMVYEHEQQLLEKGISENGFFYSYRTAAQENQTYALRAVQYEQGDYLVVFRALRQLEDGDYIFAWKYLKKFSFPKLVELK